jgi:hypothetical protein
MHNPIQGPLGKQRALLALRVQALRWIEAYKADVLARGLGFTPEDVTALQTAKAASPGPDADDVSLGLRLRMLVVGLAAVFRRYPPDGLDEGDPRLAPVAGLSFAAYATAASALGWASEDPALVARTMTALGQTPEDWKAAMDGWTARIEDDVVIATMYGQLFSQVGDLPLRRSPHP